MDEQPVQDAGHGHAALVEQQLELGSSVIVLEVVITMSVSFRRAPLRVLSLVGATRRRPIRQIPSAAGPLSPLRVGLPYSLMCWWVEGDKFASSSADPVLAVQLDLYERRISVRGRVDDKNVDVLADVTATLVALNPGDSTVDISGVSLIDAAGIACIANLGSSLAAIGADLQVVGAAARQRRRFGIASLGRLREAA